METLSTDPKKRSVQMIEIGILLLLLPVAGWIGRGGWEQSMRITAAQAHVHEADTQFRQGQLDDSLVTLEKALGEDPLCYQAYQNMSSFLWLSGQKDRAIQVYNRALVFLPDDGRVHKDLGELCVAQKNFKEAEAHLARAIQLLPPTPALVEEHAIAEKKVREGAAAAVNPVPGASPSAASQVVKDDSHPVVGASPAALPVDGSSATPSPPQSPGR